MNAAAMTTQAEPGGRIAIDIGSTVVKIATVGQHGELLSQKFFPRDFESGIARQVKSLLDGMGAAADRGNILVCSSANGGLRIGILCLTLSYSGATVRNQVLLAGANPVFVRDLDEQGGNPSHVDILLVAGAIDCEEATPLWKRLERLNLGAYRYGSLVYAGNRFLADFFRERFPGASVIGNPLSAGISNPVGSVFEAVRRAYLDDLVYKEGVSELHGDLANGVRPTPEVVSQGFSRAVLNRSPIQVVGACILLDIGGATTDVHYTVELVRDDSEARPAPGSSVARYVFTDLGVVASRDTLLLQLRSHPRLYEFLESAMPDGGKDVYQSLREGDYAPTPEVLSYGCLFLALDRFAKGRGPGLPTADLAKVAQIILTGGAAQALSEATVARVALLLRPASSGSPMVVIDRRYQIWVEGIVWTEVGSARP